VTGIDMTDAQLAKADRDQQRRDQPVVRQSRGVSGGCPTAATRRAPGARRHRHRRAVASDG
jgi:hypothetical protein